MDSYNNGDVVNFFQITDYDKAAKDFSEGNRELKQLLLNCFRNKIETIACCKGHRLTNEKPYIAFRYCLDNQQVIYAILSRLEKRDISFIYNKNNCYSYFSFCFNKCSEASVLFSEINGAINEFDQEKDYFLTLPKYLQEYVTLVKLAEHDESLKVDINDQFSIFQLGYEKIRKGYQYFLISNDIFYGRNACQSGFQKQEDDFFPTFVLKVPSKEFGLECFSNFVSNVQKSLFLFKSIDDDNIEIGEDGQLKVAVGDTLDDVAQKLLICKKHNQKIFAIFNGIKIDNYKNNMVEDIKEQYFRQWKLKGNERSDEKVLADNDLDDFIKRVSDNFGVDLSKVNGRSR